LHRKENSHCCNENNNERSIAKYKTSNRTPKPDTE